MTVDPTNGVIGKSAAAAGKAIVNAHKATLQKGAELAGALTKGANGNQTENAPVPGEKTGGIHFTDGTLKQFEQREERYKDNNGVLQTRVIYKATLTDGTVVEYMQQHQLEDGTVPTIKKNKDGSFDFVGLEGVNITDTPKDDMYNLMGCKFTRVKADNDRKTKDNDTIIVANHQLEDGKIRAYEHINVEYNAGDAVSDLFYSSVDNPEPKEYDGEVWAKRGFAPGASIDENEKALSIERQDIGKGRTKTTKRTMSEDTVVVHSHDGKELKDSYLNATEQVLADGYRIKTSPDGQEQWFYDPQGNNISKEEFRNRGL